MPGYSQTQTKNGYALGDCVSALQKCCRRGEEELALFWALEIGTVNAAYLWNRLAVIASEDVGIADNSIALLVPVMRERFYDNLRRTNGNATVFLSHAVMAICRAQKSNAANWLVMRVQLDLENPEIPDYAFDMHTRAGRMKKRAWTFFFTVSTVLRPKAEIEGEARYRQLAWEMAEAKGGAWTLRVDVHDLKRGARGAAPQQEQQEMQL